MTTYFILAYFRECIGAATEREVIKAQGTDKNDVETRIKKGYNTCVCAIAFDTMEQAANWE